MKRGDVARPCRQSGYQIDGLSRAHVVERDAVIAAEVASELVDAAFGQVRER